MHRFYLPPEDCEGTTFRLGGREAHHGVHVLRLKRGEGVTVLNGAGGIFLCEVENAVKDAVTLILKEKRFASAPSCAITLLVAIPKGKIIEDIIQKAVELGAHRIVPLMTDRVVTQLDGAGVQNKREKWQQVAVEAIKQSGAAWLPQVAVPVTISGFLARPEEIEFSLVGSLQTERRHPREWLLEFQKKHNRKPRTAAAWIGPEGDFTLTELKAIEAAGGKPITLGNLTLRVETAAVYCLSLLSYELQA